MDSRANLNQFFLLFFLVSLYVEPFKLCLGDGLPRVKCIDKEREALLTFKEDLHYLNDDDHFDRFSSWVGQDCCQWEGILCNNRTGQVARIDLRNKYLDPNGRSMSKPAYYQSCLSGKINPCLLSLEHLNYLDLSGNDFHGIPIPNFFGKLKSLQYLNISFAFFGGEIPPSLGNLSNLNYLDLGNYYSPLLEMSSRNLNWLSHLSSLTHLNLGGVNLSNTGVSWLHSVNMLPSLLELHLSDCQIENFPLSLHTINFTSLSVLEMSYNNIGSSFPSWLFNLSSLRKLDLSSNSFSGPFPSAFASLKSLEELDLSGMHLKGQIPKPIANLCKLKILSLAYNNFDGGFQEFLSGFTNCPNNSLESLELSNNEKLSDQLPASLGMLKNLKHLDLSFNLFWGSIPESIGNLSSLKTLDLSMNRMNGSIPESFGQLSELVNLDLSKNSWEGILTEAHFMNLTRLEYIAIVADIGSMSSLVIDVAYDWVPPFKLQTIRIQNCRVGPAFAVWLQSQTEPIEVTLSGTGISGTIPEEWLLKISSQLQYLDLSHNQLRGKLPFQVIKFSNLFHLDLSHNQFEGPLQLWSTNGDSFSELMPNLRRFDLSYNHLKGIIPPAICNMPNITILSLRNNQLSGEFPQVWSLWSAISVVDVSNNNLSGNIPSSMGIPSSLQILKMKNNNFGGEIPSLLQNCSNMRRLDLGYNKFIGNLPLWIGSKVSTLQMLQLRANFLRGHIPQQLCNLSQLQVLDLGQNNFSGTIPKCLTNITALAKPKFHGYWTGYFGYVEETTVTSKGRELEYTNSNLPFLRSIDLSSNNLDGEIPEEITGLIGLGILNLSMNQLSGSMPSKIGNLHWLETLDLSHNHLSGQIPQSLSSLTFLAHLNLSYNNLSGRIPKGNQLQTLIDSSIYEGNPSLCGFPLSTNCVGDETPTGQTSPAQDNNEDGNDNEVLWFYFSVVLGFIIGFWGVCGTLLIKKSWRYAYFQFFDNIKDKAALAISLKVARLQRNF